MGILNANSTPFPVERLGFVSGPDEYIIRGGRNLFGLLPTALAEIKQIGFIGWGSQGPAQAQNFRDSLAAIGSDIKVVVGLRSDSKSIKAAQAAGFNSETGTLGEMYSVINGSDLVILLISDGAQAREYPEIFKAMRPGSTLGLSHGFLEGHLANVGGSFPNNINVVMVAPKGMGPSVRKLYEQGMTTGGSGINSSVAIYQDVTGTACRIATGWAIAIGSPVTFETTIPNEWRSDLFGERGILLGGLWGMVEALYEKHQLAFASEEDSFQQSVLALTSFVSPEISKRGLKGFFQQYVAGSHFEAAFNNGYAAAYNPFLTVMKDIYANVASGQEIANVVLATEGLSKVPMVSIESEPMWRVGERVRQTGVRVTDISVPVAYTGGAYTAGVMAHLRLLLEKGHCVSEIINEGLIEGTDSLIPFMDARGVAFMVDNCSITARLGTRRYGPVFKKLLASSFRSSALNLQRKDDWTGDIIHQDIATCYTLKPTVAIAVAA